MLNDSLTKKATNAPPKKEEALIRLLMSMNFQQKVIQYVTSTVTSCGEK